jgi:hypothetical protein
VQDDFAVRRGLTLEDLRNEKGAYERVLLGILSDFGRVVMDLFRVQQSAGRDDI